MYGIERRTDMAYNNFPVGYQPAQIYYPQYNQSQYMQQPNQQTQPQQTMTPPMIHAEIVQVDNEQAAESYPLSAGTSQMMIAKDDSAIYVKTMYPNGQYKLDAFIKRPEAPRNAARDSDIYITRDEFESRLNEILEARTPKTRRKEEPVKAKEEGES